MTEYLTIGPVATKLGIPRWRLAYLIDRGDVPGPSLQVPGRRLFTREDIQRLRDALASICSNSKSRSSAVGSETEPEGLPTPPSS
jgi:hypothetical protein